MTAGGDGVVADCDGIGARMRVDDEWAACRELTELLVARFETEDDPVSLGVENAVNM